MKTQGFFAVACATGVVGLDPVSSAIGDGIRETSVYTRRADAERAVDYGNLYCHCRKRGHRVVELVRK